MIETRRLKNVVIFVQTMKDKLWKNKNNLSLRTQQAI